MSYNRNIDRLACSFWPYTWDTTVSAPATKVRPTYKTFIFDNQWHSKVIGAVVGLIMIALYLWLLSGVVMLLIKLYEVFLSGWLSGAEEMIKDTVIMLATLELIRTLQSYLLLGRVKVTFILDVTLVVLIGELISLWYRKYEATEVFLVLFVVATLVALRIITTKYSPASESEMPN